MSLLCKSSPTGCFTQVNRLSWSRKIVHLPAKFQAKHSSVRQIRAYVTNHSGADTEDEASSRAPAKNAGMRVAYQGVPGAYSEGAVQIAYPGCDAIAYAAFDDAYEAVKQWETERAVLPVENSLGGSIHRVYDLMLARGLFIVGEVQRPISHCLLAPKGTRIEDIEVVMSHPQALAQTEQYLRNLHVKIEAQADTAGSAKLIQDQGLVGVAAVASSRAAELYDMDILDADIQDDKNNVTRFVALSRNPCTPNIPGEIYKTSIVFSFVDGPGMLFKALGCFALRGIDTTKIESRPMKNNPLVKKVWGDSVQFNYIFYLDFRGSTTQVEVQNALRNLEELTTFLQVLGCYPMDVSDPLARKIK
ncbi:hypothetical protein CYMTET_29791 [Cymbomonas tetramitiformis]|uniref:arogenate dehydratase n=1 Tax=Cymbomonas tetramitiformis TaxID=36881 RepID=A0AAE0FKB0_9CHLO|nr:hypothetical protein CYMTET_29791 [Cymbomonas tetramitiformis]